MTPDNLAGAPDALPEAESRSTRFCSACGRRLDGDEKYCPECGGAVPQSPASRPFAPSCEKETAAELLQKGAITHDEYERLRSDLRASELKRALEPAGRMAERRPEQGELGRPLEAIRAYAPFILVLAVGVVLSAYAKLPYVTDGPGGEESYSLARMRELVASGVISGAPWRAFAACWVIVALGVLLGACAVFSWRGWRPRLSSIGAVVIAGLGLFANEFFAATANRADVNNMLVLGPGRAVLAAAFLSSGVAAWLLPRANAVAPVPQWEAALRLRAGGLLQDRRRAALAGTAVLVVVVGALAAPGFLSRGNSVYMTNGTWFTCRWRGSPNQGIDFRNGPFGGSFAYWDYGTDSRATTADVHGTWRVQDGFIYLRDNAGGRETQSANSRTASTLYIVIPGVGARSFSAQGSQY